MIIIGRFDMKSFFKRIKQFFKFKYQHITKGFSDQETWNLDANIAKYILPRLKRFKEINNGHPVEVSAKEWDIILDKMINSFEFHIQIFVDQDDDDLNTMPKNAQKRKWEEYNEGLLLFAKYYKHLWW